MQTRLVALILISSVGLLGACSSDADPSPDPSSSSSSSSPSSGTGGSEAVPALRLKGQFGTGSYCLIAGSNPEDYLWSGTWLAAHEDATITDVAPVASGNLDVVGSWVVEDDRDDGEFAPWSLAARSTEAHRVPLRGAQLTGGTAYRVVLRLRPHRPLPSEVSGIAVDYRSGDESDTVIDDSTLRIAADC